MEEETGKKGGGFEELIVWQKSMDLVTEVYRLCQHKSIATDFALKDQIRRAAISIPANIAEGYERASRKEYINFVMIAKGSAAGELRCLLQIVSRLGLGEPEKIRELLDRVPEIARMLKGLAKALRE